MDERNSDTSRHRNSASTVGRTLMPYLSPLTRELLLHYIIHILKHTNVFIVETFYPSSKRDKIRGWRVGYKSGACIGSAGNGLSEELGRFVNLKTSGSWWERLLLI